MWEGRVTKDLGDSVRGDVEIGGQLGSAGTPTVLCFETDSSFGDFLEKVTSANWETNRSARIGDTTADRLADPPSGVRRELEALAPVKLFDGVDESEVSLLHEIEKGQTGGLVLPRD